MSIGPMELAIICGMLFLLIIVPSAVLYLVVLRSRKANQEKRIPCPYCAELILPEAKICRYCGRALDNRPEG